MKHLLLSAIVSAVALGAFATDITVAHLNIGHFSRGTKQNVQFTNEVQHAKAKERYRKHIQAVKADLWGLAENSDAFAAYKGKTFRTRDELFGEYPIARMGRNRDGNCNSIFASAAFVKPVFREIDFLDSVQDRYFTEMEAELDGQKVLIAETHLDWNQSKNARWAVHREMDGKDSRPLQIQQLIERYRNEPRVIVMADFNVTGDAEFDVLRKAGFASASGGKFPLLFTCDSRKPKLAIDNIFVKGFEILEADTFGDAVISDHLGIRAKLRPLPVEAAKREAQLPWKEDLWLEGYDYWKRRMVLTFTNDTDKDWIDRTIAVKTDRLGRIRDSELRTLRLTDAKGREIRLGMGKVKGGKAVVMPICVPARGKAQYCLYYGNNAAWELSETWNRKPEAILKPLVVRERIEMKEIGWTGKWPERMQREDGWFRLPLLVMNCSDAERGEALAVFNLAEAAHALKHPDLVLMHNGEERLCAPYGNTLLFPVKVPPKTVLIHYLYLRDSGRKDEGRATSSIAGNFMLASTSVMQTISMTDREKANLAAIVDGEANLLKNVGRVEMPGDASRWTGFSRPVAAEEGTRYFAGVLMNAENLKGEWWLSAAGGKMQYALRGPTGGWIAQWILADANLKKPPKFTCNGRFSGKVTFDSAIFARYANVTPFRREYPTREAEGLVVRQVDPTVKVFPDERIADAKGGWKVALARNENEDVQLAVRNGKRIGRLEMEIVPPQNDAGAKLVCEPMFTELVPVDAVGGNGGRTGGVAEMRHPKRVSKAGDGWKGLWPDPLVRTNGCDLAARETRAFRIVVKAGAAEPGIYRGKVLWKADGKVIREDALSVKVWNFDIGERPEFSGTHDIRFERNYWLAPGEKKFDAAWERMADLMAEYKIEPEQFKYGKIFTRDESGKITADFTEHDRGADDFFNRRGFLTAYFPRTPFYVFGYSNKIRPFLGVEPYEPGEKDTAKLSPKYVEAYQTALKMYWEHIKEKGWADRMVLYVSDEPTYWNKEVVARLKAVCAMIRAVDRKIPIYSSTWGYKSEWDDSITVWGAGSYGCFPLEAMKKVKEMGSRLWFTTDGQMCMTTPYCAIEQLLPVYAHFHGSEKYEYWGVNWVTLPPWKFGYHSYSGEGTAQVRGESGSGFCAYPAYPGGSDPRPCPSIRMAALRDGVELHAYLVALDKLALGGGEKAERAKAVLRQFEALCVIPNAGGRLSSVLLKDDPEVISRLRHAAGELLSR